MHVGSMLVESNNCTAVLAKTINYRFFPDPETQRHSRSPLLAPRSPIPRYPYIPST